MHVTAKPKEKCFASRGRVKSVDSSPIGIPKKYPFTFNFVALTPPDAGRDYCVRPEADV